LNSISIAYFIWIYRSASRKAFRSTTKDNARANQALSAEKREKLYLQNQQIPTLDVHPESKEIAEGINKKLTNIINEKQQIIVGITQKLGEFINSFRDVRKVIDEIKEGKAGPNDIANLEKYLTIVINIIYNSLIIATQNDTDIWHKNCLTDEGTGITVYDLLKELSDAIINDHHDSFEFYQNQFARLIGIERESAEVNIS